MKSLSHKILISSLIVILLPMALAIFWSSKTLSSLLQRRFVEKSKARAERALLLLNEKQQIATGLVHWIAGMPGVKRALEEGNRDELFQLLLPLVGSAEMDLIEIMDSKGAVLLRVQDPSRYGDHPELTEEFVGMLEGRRDLPNYGVELRGEKAYLRAVEVIEDQGKILGIISSGYELRPHLLGKLEEVTEAAVRINVGGRLYSPLKRGTPVATPVPLPVHSFTEIGPDHSLNVHMPLETARGREGLITLAFPSRDVAATIQSLQKMLILVSLVGIGLAFFVSWILSRRLIKPLKSLVSATEQVADGNYSGSVPNPADDEIGALSTSFNRMLEELRKSEAQVESYRKELERKFAEKREELEETEQKRAAMAHMIAHDLKNPLLGIKKTLERLVQSPPDAAGEQQKRTLEDLLSAGDLVIGMVNEMLDLYRSDFGDIPLSMTSFPMDQVLETSLRVLGPEIEEKQIEVVDRSDALRIPVTGDKRRLTRMFINLLSNAIKFSPVQGRIYVLVSLLGRDGGSDSQVLIRVEDEGVGVAEEGLDRIFDRFSSRDQGSIEAGTGLGLPYCKLVAEAHRGRIWAENQKGRGFAVSVVFPANTAEGQRAYGT